MLLWYILPTIIAIIIIQSIVYDLYIYFFAFLYSLICQSPLNAQNRDTKDIKIV